MRRPRTLCCMLVRLATLSCIAAATPASAGESPQEQSLAIGGRTRSFVLHVPASLSTESAVSPAPLLLVFHGMGGSGANALAQGRWIAKANAEGFIVAAPNGVAEREDRRTSLVANPRSWNSGENTGSPAQRMGVDDIAFVRELIDTLVAQHRADPRRVYATGFSNGAAMAFRVGAELPDRVAAIAPVANALLVPLERLAAPVSLLMIWGTADPLNPIAGGAVKRSGGRVTRPSAEQSWSQWARLLECPAAAVIETPAAKVTRRAYRGCAAGSAAELVTIEGLGHQWPGGENYVKAISGPGSDAVNATDVIWEFFSRYSRAGR